MDFDEDRIYYSHQNLAVQRGGGGGDGDGTGNAGASDARNEATLDLEDGDVDLGAVRRHFREFLREYLLLLLLLPFNYVLLVYHCRCRLIFQRGVF